LFFLLSPLFFAFFAFPIYHSLVTMSVFSKPANQAFVCGVLVRSFLNDPNHVHLVYVVLEERHVIALWNGNRRVFEELGLTLEDLMKRHRQDPLHATVYYNGGNKPKLPLSAVVGRKYRVQLVSVVSGHNKVGLAVDIYDGKNLLGAGHVTLRVMGDAKPFHVGGMVNNTRPTSPVTKPSAFFFPEFAKTADAKPPPRKKVEVGSVLLKQGGVTVLSPDLSLFKGGQQGRQYLWTQERVKAAWDKFWTVLDHLLKEGNLKIVILQGPAASGKSTWLRDNAANLSGCIVLDATFTLRNYFTNMANLAGESGHQHTFRVIRFRTSLADRLRLDKKRADDQTSGRDALPEEVHQRMEEQNKKLTDAMIQDVLPGCEIVGIKFEDNSSGGGAKAD